MSIITSIPIKELYRLDSIRKIYGMEKVDHEVFSIPDYQRGYRWDVDVHVEALLNDIRDFMNMQQRNDEKYCLQPIVVSRSMLRPGAWEVIDGQQRLTTIYLILKELGYGDETFGLVYEARAKSNDFIRRLISENVQSHDTPDFHFMSASWEKINQWLDKENKKSPRFSQKFGIALWENVNVIWFDIESTDIKVNIDVFNRLNVGKIPLTDAELVKALILSKIKGLYKDRHELTMRQAEISAEWHRMEIELRKPTKWGFLTGNVDKEYDSHIELLFDLLANNISKENERRYTTYLWFEKQIASAGNDLKKQAEKAVELWNKIKDAYARINSWFCDSTPDTDPTTFHYVGYLLAARKEKIQNPFNLADGKSKKAFERELRRLVLHTVEDIDLSSLSYEENKEEIKLVLLLFNVLTCQQITKGAYNRFPFDRYNDVAKHGNGGWSIEHIYAQHSQEPIKDRQAAFRWLSDTKRSIQNIDTVSKKTNVENEGRMIQETKLIDITALKNKLDEMLSSGEKGINLDDVDVLRQNLTNIFGEVSRHPLSNLALLSKNDNSSLNNAIFPTKRDKIIKLEREGSFIPPCTRNVFLKFYSTADSQPFYWSEEDQESYLNNIMSIINTFKGK